MFSGYPFSMETNRKRSGQSQGSYKTPVEFQRYRKFLESHGFKKYSPRLVQLLAELHRQSLNGRLVARAIAYEAAEERCMKKTESPKARSNSTTTEAEG